MSGNTSKQAIGYVLMKKTAGTGSPAIGTQLLLPILEARPRDPRNNIYAPAVNKTLFPSLVILGRRTPSIAFRSFLKTSYTNAAFATSLISSFDANNDVDTWAILLNDGTTGGTWSNRIFDGCKGVMLAMAGSAGGGGITLDMSFLAQSAQGSTSFSTGSLVPDAGQEIDTSQVDFGDVFTVPGLGGAGSTADLVRGWRINAIRGGSYDMFYNGTYYPAGVSSGMLGGTVQLEQSPKYVKSPSSSFIVRIGNSGSPVLTATALVNLDEDVLDLDAGLGDIFRTYTLIDTSAGGNPLVFS